MGCFKTLTFNEAAPVGDTPLFSAVYVPSTDTILGTMENYVVEFDSTTGTMIRAVKFIAPMYGPMWIGLVNDLPWVSCRMDLSIQNQTYTAMIRRDIFQLDTTTLEPTGTKIDLPAKHVINVFKQNDGPLSFFGIGNRMIWLLENGGVHYAFYTDVTNVTVWGGNWDMDFGWWTEHGCTDGTDAYFAAGGANEIRWRNGSTLNPIDFSDTGSYVPCSVTWVSGSVNKPYAICADGTMIRVDDFATSLNTVWDLATLASLPGIKPLRIRYNSVDKNIYIPCQEQNSIIVFDSVAETAVVKAGFDSPIDLVFTPTKIFAVQSGLVGLKEVV